MLWGSNFRAGWQLRGTREWCVIPYLSLLIWNTSSLSGVGKKELLPLFVLLKLSDTAISLGAEQNSAGGRQSQPLTVSAIVALAEYKGADQRRKSSRHIFPSAAVMPVVVSLTAHTYECDGRIRDATQVQWFLHHACGRLQPRPRLGAAAADCTLGGTAHRGRCEPHGLMLQVYIFAIVGKTCHQVALQGQSRTGLSNNLISLPLFDGSGQKAQSQSYKQPRLKGRTHFLGTTNNK